MHIDAENSELRKIPINLIDRNPENPRIHFRQGEFDELLESIRTYGVQVPVAVYKEGRRYVLIDGERRWKCSLKLNKRTIPALVQEKPDPLTGLLLMFNIHALREQWDLLTIALKLPRVIKLLSDELGKQPNERELSKKTGLRPGVIRRCKLLIELPKNFQDLIIKELHKPKSQQKLTEDFFIEMERSLKTVERAMPNLIENKDVVRKVLIEKYLKKTISNIVHLRLVARIARAEAVDVDQEKAVSALKKLFSTNNYSIEQAYEQSVSEAYTERDLITRVHYILSQLDKVNTSELEEELLEALKKLQKRLRALLEGPQ